jgi:hypothetical protein
MKVVWIWTGVGQFGFLVGSVGWIYIEEPDSVGLHGPRTGQEPNLMGLYGCGLGQELDQTCLHGPKLGCIFRVFL